MTDDNIRYEIDHNDKMVQGATSLSSDLTQLVHDLFSQRGWTYTEETQHSAYRKVKVTSPLGNVFELNLFTGNIRNEKRSPYEKKIQLNKEDPRQYKNGITLILGFYVFHADDSINDAIIVGYPVDESVSYDTNPSLRGVFVNDILLKAKVNGVCFDRERKIVGFRPEFIFYYLSSYNSFHGYSGEKYTNLDMIDDFYPEKIEETEGANYSVNVPDETDRVKGGCNTLLYGVPGSGKSYTIEHEYCDDEDRMERLVFHPDYTYSDFVGQILPNVDDGVVSYKFTPGPFTNLLKKAYDNPEKEYYLIIEEINRGNAPAIFGEVFQLLDRDENGTSEYGITNSDVSRIVYQDENRKVRIPSNMSIAGTMNTSDQNVFTLDTAFQRRWSMRMIENDMNKAEKEFANHKILNTEVTWKQFNQAINNIILRKNIRMTSSEDKRLGAYFVSKNDLEYNPAERNNELPEKERLKAARDNSRFPEKVLKYLWDDAFKFSREDIFETSLYISLEDIVRKFETSEGNERFTVFKEDVLNAIISGDTDNQGE